MLDEVEVKDEEIVLIGKEILDGVNDLIDLTKEVEDAKTVNEMLDVLKEQDITMDDMVVNDFIDGVKSIEDEEDFNEAIDVLNEDMVLNTID
jgi:hypothetical protein